MWLRIVEFRSFRLIRININSSGRFRLGRRHDLLRLRRSWFWRLHVVRFWRFGRRRVVAAIIGIWIGISSIFHSLTSSLRVFYGLAADKQCDCGHGAEIYFIHF